MAQSFQKSAVALLLAAPSNLNRYWLSGDRSAVTAELARLGVHGDALTAANREMERLDRAGKKAVFAEVADELKGMWDGNEPHPDPSGAKRIVTALHALDAD